MHPIDYILYGFCAVNRVLPEQAAVADGESSSRASERNAFLANLSASQPPSSVAIKVQEHEVAQGNFLCVKPGLRLS